MSPLLHPLLRQVGLPVSPQLANLEVRSISCDSRRVGPGTVFVGLPGTRVDGGQFWPDVLAAGACAAVISPAAAAAVPPGADDAVIVAQEPMALVAGRLSAEFWQQPSQQIGRAHV